MTRVDQFERYRIEIPSDAIEFEGQVSEFFDVCPNSSGLTEEFLYTHQPITANTINIYSTSPMPIGALDDTDKINEEFNVLTGPLLLIARKGYAGRLSVIEDEKCIIHEDAYAASIKEPYKKKVDLYWFSGHYSFLFQSNRTSSSGIGDFPRKRFLDMNVIIPTIEYQKKISSLYKRRALIAAKLSKLDNLVDGLISRAVE